MMWHSDLDDDDTFPIMFKINNKLCIKLVTIRVTKLLITSQEGKSPNPSISRTIHQQYMEFNVISVTPYCVCAGT